MAPGTVSRRKQRPEQFKIVSSVSYQDNSPYYAAGGKSKRPVPEVQVKHVSCKIPKVEAKCSEHNNLGHQKHGDFNEKSDQIAAECISKVHIFEDVQVLAVLPNFRDVKQGGNDDVEKWHKNFAHFYHGEQNKEAHKVAQKSRICSCDSCMLKTLTCVPLKFDQDVSQPHSGFSYTRNLCPDPGT
mmetsp:Transcript_25272/g.41009  ORF Transcript_25272/g.41009 Transcript_25272/m.41009 type:complete len:185 (+) Transcript_25272:97-651(+)